MPIYEYEPADHECLICSGKVEIIQKVGDEPFQCCPTCGLPIRKLVSRATFKTATPTDADRAARKGLTTFRKVEKGKWEKVAGPGVDMIVGSPEQIKEVEEAQRPKRVVDLDKP